MADIDFTAAQVAPVHPGTAEIYDFIAAAAITKGQALYLNSSGKVDLADASSGSAATTGQFIGVALKTVAANQSVSVLTRGAVYGYTLTGVAYAGIVYLSNTAGDFATTTDGDVNVACGRVISLTDSSLTKVLFVDASHNIVWS